MLLYGVVCVSAFLFLFFRLTFTFQLLDKLWSQVPSLLSPVRAFSFYRAYVGFSIPTARRFSSNVANSRSRAFLESICVQEKVSYEFIRKANYILRSNNESRPRERTTRPRPLFAFRQKKAWSGYVQGAIN